MTLIAMTQCRGSAGGRWSAGAARRQLPASGAVAAGSTRQAADLRRSAGQCWRARDAWKPARLEFRPRPRRLSQCSANTQVEAAPRPCRYSNCWMHCSAALPRPPPSPARSARPPAVPKMAAGLPGSVVVPLRLEQAEAQAGLLDYACRTSRGAVYLQCTGAQGVGPCTGSSQQLSGTDGRQRGPCHGPHRCHRRQRRKTAGRRSLARLLHPLLQGLRPAAHPPPPPLTT